MFRMFQALDAQTRVSSCSQRLTKTADSPARTQLHTWTNISYFPHSFSQHLITITFTSSYNHELFTIKQDAGQNGPYTF